MGEPAWLKCTAVAQQKVDQGTKSQNFLRQWAARFFGGNGAIGFEKENQVMSVKKRAGATMQTQSRDIRLKRKIYLLGKWSVQV